MTERVYQILELFEERYYSNREVFEELTPYLLDEDCEAVSVDLYKIKGTRFFIMRVKETPV